MSAPRLPTAPPTPPPASPDEPRKPRPFRATLGTAVQRHRLRCGLTQGQLAEFADLSLKYVGEIERGEANTTLEVIEKLADTLGWNPMDALDGAREPITEGIRLHLLAVLQRTRERFADMEEWLHALGPAERPDSPGLARFKPSARPQRAARSRARPSTRRRSAE